ncbi:metaxin-1-like isoform X2 [Acanthaster planci]|uniref:Metaxin n=1 Tax=Acanthaster planci TaxID=133434 RepID=A0A8B7ZLQ1_ACAPL|nr:metaxin-1-like isoform X2 [Acanthaster planci]
MAASSESKDMIVNDGPKKTIEFDCWKGDWGLPSVDVKCLNVLTYAQFAGASLRVHKNRFLWQNLAAHLPMLHAGEGVVRSDTEAIQYLKETQANLDGDLTDQQRADSLALKALMEEKYLPGLLHAWWVDAKNYVELIRPWYAKALQFPLNYFVPGRLKRAAERRVEVTRGGEHMEAEEITSRVYSDAKECINLLSEKLGDEDFFFGPVPTSLDALIFSYLAPLLRAPLPSNQLQMHLKATDNLCRFCSRILLRYFPDEPQDPGPTSSQKSPTEDPFDDPHKRRNQVLAAVVAMTAMASYAFLSGLVRVQMTDSDGSGIELDYDDGEEGH